MYHSFLIHSSVNGHLGCFHVLVIAIRAVMNSGIHVSSSILISSGYMPSSRIAGSYGGFIPNFLRSLHTVFWVNKRQGMAVDVKCEPGTGDDDQVI